MITNSRTTKQLTKAELLAQLEDARIEIQRLAPFEREALELRAKAATPAAAKPPRTELLAKLGKLAQAKAASAPNIYRHARSRALFRTAFVTRFKAEPTTADYAMWDATRAAVVLTA